MLWGQHLQLATLVLDLQGNNAAHILGRWRINSQLRVSVYGIKCLFIHANCITSHARGHICLQDLRERVVLKTDVACGDKEEEGDCRDL